MTTPHLEPNSVLNVIWTANKVLCSRMKQGDFPSSLVFAYLMNNRVNNRRNVIIIEGTRLQTDKAIREYVIPLFPSDSVVIETIGIKGLWARDLDKAHLLYIPNIDSKQDTWKVFETWTEGEGFVFEHARERKNVVEIEKVEIGHTPVIISCESTDQLPSWLKDISLILPARIKDADWKDILSNFPTNEQITSGEENEDQLRKRVHGLINNGVYSIVFFIPFRDGLAKYFDERLMTINIESDIFTSILEAICALLARDRYILVKNGVITVVVSPGDFKLAARIANISTSKGWKLTVDDTIILNAIRGLSKTNRSNPDTSKWVSTASIKDTIGMNDSHSVDEHRDRTIPVRTIYAKLDRMVKLGILQVRGRGRGTMYEYKINDALGIETNDKNERNDFFVELNADYNRFIINEISELGYQIVNRSTTIPPSRDEDGGVEGVMGHA